MSKVKELRDKNEIKQEDLAEYLGISPASYSKKETGQIRFSLVEAKRLSIFFKISIDEIFFNDEVSISETLEE